MIAVPLRHRSPRSSSATRTYALPQAPARKNVTAAGDPMNGRSTHAICTATKA